MKGVEFKLHTVLAYMYISISQAKGKPVWTIQDPGIVR